MSKVKVNVGENGFKAPASAKFKLGGRKMKSGAHDLSTEALLKLVDEPKRKRDSMKVLKVLAARGVAVPAQSVESV